MDPNRQVKRTIILLWCISIVAAAAAVDDDNPFNANNTKTVSLGDPSVDATVKSALANGSVSEVVVRKDLLLFPVNAPDLVIAHRHEIHAIPGNVTNSTDKGQTGTAEVAEVHEYSLSQLVPSNKTDDNQESSNRALAADLFSKSTQNNSILEPQKMLHFITSFNMKNGTSTEKVPLPREIQDISIPKESIEDILSKSISNSMDAQSSSTDEPPSAGIEADNTDLDDVGAAASMLDSETEDSLLPTSDVDVDDVDDSDVKVVKRSLMDSNQTFENYTTSDRPDYYAVDGRRTTKGRFVTKEKEEEKDMDVAEDIVFRPLFRYRQEMRLKQRYSPNGYRSKNRKDYKNDYNDYDNDNNNNNNNNRNTNRDDDADYD